MKRLNNLYNQILDVKIIKNTYDKKIKINTKNKQKLERFEYNYVSNIVYIKNILEKRKYQVGKYNIFIIKEPKIRLIMSQNIIDKIINHIVTEYFLIRPFENTLINENIATRKNKGTSYGIKLLKKYLNKVKFNEFYILKFDIEKYFFNIDHTICKKIIRKKIKDKEVLKLLDEIIDSTDCEYINKTIQKNKMNEILKHSTIKNEISNIPLYKKGKGLPIGNMSSQFLAILYLNELDHFIKQELNIKYYSRYMDDGLIIHENKEYLEYCLQKINEIIKKYKLKFNDKTKIYSYKQGFEFLGFKYYIKNKKVIVKVKNQTKKRFKRKMKSLKKLVDEEKISYDIYHQIQSSYLGHLKYGNTKKLIEENILIEKNLNMGQIVVIKNDNIALKNNYGDNTER